ncbi:M3 family oligoendopeptidase [Caldalkalibacillus salinus]|uniref:M3 family oligoendopeptidase n=1 Tax=Caldalkalibacillus salinus TaxID=2803787 RepID=UPI00192266F1|nr:M3 family oligoendopeptidase [Caldalkalibacillus salinus]
MTQTLSQNWDLDTFFPGGSDSQAFQDYLTKLKEDLERLNIRVKDMFAPTASDQLAGFSALIHEVQDTAVRLREASAFTSCLTAQDMKDNKATLLSGTVKSLRATYATILTNIERILTEIPEDLWLELVRHPEFEAISFYLGERRQAAREKLSPDMEALVSDLSVDGYHGWGELYNTTVGNMAIPYEDNGETKHLSVGQAQNKLSDPDKTVRDTMFEKWEKAWSAHADFCSDALNHLSGFRLSLYKNRGWHDVHKEPLDYNRMSGQTLQAMWKAIDDHKSYLLSYFERKAQLLGVEKLDWNDVSAPIGNVSKAVSYDEAADFIIKHFETFSPKMASFTKKVFEESWIEAEDRPGKRPGGFCTSFPDSKQTRIFMTYSGSASNVATLAHELGHAYHQHVMNDLPPMAQQYAMNVAETASTFAELIVADASIKEAQNKDEKIALLDNKIQRSVAFFMNIHARFIFETAFYEERKRGLVPVSRLNELMVQAQKEAYKDALGSYHPHLWASKLHFYLTQVPFYNFPYTFGFLFSAGVYLKAMEEGQDFENRYIALLQDTASMTVEQLAHKHLDADLTSTAFWESAIQLVLQDVNEFLTLTNE